MSFFGIIPEDDDQHKITKIYRVYLIKKSEDIAQLFTTD